MEPARRTANQTNPVAFTASSGSRVPSGAIFPAGRSGHADPEHCHGNAFRPGERRGGGLPCRAIGSDEGGQVMSGQKAKAKKGVIERGKKVAGTHSWKCATPPPASASGNGIGCAKP